MENSRKRTRVEGHFKGRLETGSASLPMTTENLSLKGLLCNLEQDADILAPGARVSVVLPLADDVVLEVEGAVVRHAGRQVAVDFEAMDEESYTHLRNIVRLGSRDPDAIDKEQIDTPFLEDGQEQP